MFRPISYGGSTGRTFRSNAPVPPLPENAALQSSMSNTFPRDDMPLVKEVSSRRPSLKTSMMERLGSSESFMLITTTLCILASIAFISFLWFGDDRNTTWRNLASNGHIVIAVSLSSLVLRVAMVLQAGMATCMLASLALEETGVLLPHVASVSMIRNSNSGPQALAYFLLQPTALRKNWSYKKYLAPGLLVFLLLTTFLSQLTSTALLSDISVGLVSGHFVQSSPATNLENNRSPTSSQTSTWFKRPISYAAFAEYKTKTIVTRNPSRISDTGLSLRALLPISDRQDRISLQKYSGSATLIDTRVLCIALDAVLDETGNLAFLSVPQEALQNYTKSAGSTVRLVQDIRNPTLIPFSDVKIDSLGNFTINQLSAQLTRSFLLGQFQELSNGTDPFSTKENTFNQYIITRVVAPFPNNTLPRSLGNPAQSTNSEWLSLSYKDFASSIRTVPEIAISLCYNSLSALDMAIIASTNSTRIEALPGRSNANTGLPILDNVRNQLGDFGGSPNERGLLEITFPDSVPQGPSSGKNNSNYIRGDAQWVQLNGTSRPHPLTLSTAGAGVNTSHPDLANLLNQIMASSGSRLSTGSIAFAMQSLITVLAQTVYYEQLPHFNNRTLVQQTKLVPAAIPGGEASTYRSAPAGFRPGYVAVLVVVVVHISLMIGISCLFFSQTTFSTLSSSWSVLSQASDPLTKKYISASHLASDAEVSRWMREDKVDDLVVTLTSADDGRSTGLREVKRSANGVMEEGGLEISHWDERLGAGAYFYSEQIAAQRPRQKWESQRPPWM